MNAPTFAPSAAPGGINDCSKGLWEFVIDYAKPNGDVVQQVSTSAYCVEQLRVQAMSGELFLIEQGRNIPANSSLLYYLPVWARDDAAYECEATFRLSCTN